MTAVKYMAALVNGAWKKRDYILHVKDILDYVRHMNTIERGINRISAFVGRHPRAWLVFRVIFSIAIAMGLLFGTSRLIVKHPNWQPYVRDLPDVAAYALAALGAATPFLPELLKMLED